MNIEDAKILVFTVDCWNSKTGANTMSELFSWCKKDNLANVYIRAGVPDYQQCGYYFQICENEVIKSIIKRNLEIGHNVEVGTKTLNQEYEIEEKRYSKFKNRQIWPLLYLREILWKLGNWKSKALNKFLEDFNPDIIVFAHEGYIHFNRLVRYSVKKTGAKSVGYFWDDNFTYKQMPFNLGYYIYRFFQKRDIAKNVRVTDANFTISPKTKREVDNEFGIDSVILSKPLKEDKINKNEYIEKLDEPIKMLYAGNLGIGRINTIISVSKILDEINNEGKIITLDVYSGTNIDDNTRAKIGKYVNLCGSVPQREVAGLQNKADVLLFVESLEKRYRKIARLSFSTKLVDYFGSARCILAVGDSDIAPIEYMKTNDIAIVASDYDQLYNAILRIKNEQNILAKYSKASLDFGIKNHSYDVIISKLKGTLQSII